MTKFILSLLIIAPSLVEANDFSATEVSARNMKTKEKIELCESFADEKFCGSKIDEDKCINDFKFEVKTKHLKNEPKLIVQRNFKMKAINSDLEFTKKEIHQIQIGNGELTSRYMYDSYSTEGGASFVANSSFVLDTSCLGDGDSDN